MNSRRLHSITSSAMRKHARRNGEAQRLGGVEIDYKLELGGQLNWQVSWLCAPQNAIDIRCSLSPLINIVCSIEHKAPSRDEKSERINSGQTVLGRELDDELTFECGDRTWQYDEARFAASRDASNSAFDIHGVAYFNAFQGHSRVLRPLAGNAKIPVTRDFPHPEELALVLSPGTPR